MARRKSRRNYGGVSQEAAFGGLLLLAAGGGAAWYFFLSDDAKVKALAQKIGGSVMEGQRGKYAVNVSQKKVLRANGFPLIEGETEAEARAYQQQTGQLPEQWQELAFLMKKYNVDLD